MLVNNLQFTGSQISYEGDVGEFITVNCIVRNSLYEVNLHFSWPISYPCVSVVNRAAKLDWCQILQDCSNKKRATVFSEFKFGLQTERQNLLYTLIYKDCG